MTRSNQSLSRSTGWLTKHTTTNLLSGLNATEQGLWAIVKIKQKILSCSAEVSNKKQDESHDKNDRKHISCVRESTVKNNKEEFWG